MPDPLHALAWLSASMLAAGVRLLGLATYEKLTLGIALLALLAALVSLLLGVVNRRDFRAMRLSQAGRATELVGEMADDLKRGE